MSGRATRRPDLALGLMSGTSADGITAALVEIRDAAGAPRLRLLCHATFAFPPALQRSVLGLAGASVPELSRMNVALGRRFADAALRLLRAARVPTSRVAVIGSHGQTVIHLPQGDPPSTLQIGEPSEIAERTGIATVADFRPRDMAAGGGGAPLVPMLDWILYRGAGRIVAAQNLGGIGNVTVIRPERDRTWAFDTGPGNALIDEAATLATRGALRYDRDGAIARRGRIDEALLARLRRHPFLARRPPKTADRGEFGRAYVERVAGPLLRKRPADALATLTLFSAWTVFDAHRRFVFPGGRPAEVIVSGGGALNPVLMTHLRELFAPIPVRSSAETGLDPLAKEAMAFALLGWLAFKGRPNHLPPATGARRETILGKILPAPPRRLSV